jgi:hypothetical protein
VLLGNIDHILPDSIDASFLKFVTTILGIHDQDVDKHIGKVFVPDRDVRVFANSDSKKMMTLTQGEGKNNLLVKGNLETLFYQCSAFINSDGD